MKDLFIPLINQCRKRPFLFMALLSCLTGTALAFGDGIQHWSIALFTLFIISFSYYLIVVTRIDRLLNNVFSHRIIKHFLIFIFWGPVCLAGTYYIQSHEMNAAIVLASFIPGLFSTALISLTHFNKKKAPTRDKNDLEIILIFASLFSAIILPDFIYILTLDHLWTLLSNLAIFLVLPFSFSLRDKSPAKKMTNALFPLVIVHMGLFVLGWLI